MMTSFFMPVRSGIRRICVDTMKRMWKGWRQTGRGWQYRAQIVNYADDFAILSRGKAKEALEWTHGVLQRLELTLNDKKTSIRHAGGERLDFLGYTFGPHTARARGGSTWDTARLPRACPGLKRQWASIWCRATWLRGRKYASG